MTPDERKQAMLDRVLDGDPVIEPEIVDFFLGYNREVDSLVGELFEEMEEETKK